MAGLIYVDGGFVEASQARVPLLDRGYLLGDAVFETLRAYDGAPFALDRHLARLAHSAEVLAIPLPVPLAEIARLTRETVRRAGAPSAYVRVTLSRGVGGHGLGIRGAGPANLTILARELTPYAPELQASGVETLVLRARRIPAACLDPTIKSANYLPAILARRELEAGGQVEGIQLSVDGEVVSGTVSNLFLARDGALLTPRLESGCLPGVTRGILLELARAAGVDAREIRVAPEQLLAADEAFFANTLMEWLPIRAIGDRRLPAAPGPLTRELGRLLHRRIQEETADARDA